MSTVKIEIPIESIIISRQLLQKLGTSSVEKLTLSNLNEIIPNIFRQLKGQTFGYNDLVQKLAEIILK